MGAGPGRFANLGGARPAGYEGLVNDGYPHVRERSTNNARLIGGLGGQADDGIFHRDFSGNTHKSASN